MLHKPWKKNDSIKKKEFCLKSSIIPLIKRVILLGTVILIYLESDLDIFFSGCREFIIPVLCLETLHLLSLQTKWMSSRMTSGINEVLLLVLPMQGQVNHLLAQSPFFFLSPCKMITNSYIPLKIKLHWHSGAICCEIYHSPSFRLM